jgi:hypothetical protein
MINEKACVGTQAEETTKGRDKDTENFAEELISHINNQDGLEQFAHLRITDKTDIPPVEAVVCIDHNIIAAKGDITTFSGGSKTGKTLSLDAIIAAGISEDGNIIDPIPEIQVTPNTEHFAVIHIDTEQSKNRHKQKLQKNIYRAGYETCPPHFLSYNVRELSIEDYRPFTTGVLKAAKKAFGGVFMIIIDGIADYIKDPNNTEESNSIVKYIDQIAIEFDCPVIVVIHTNPNSDKERGNQGSQLQRKSASVLGVKVEDDITYLEPKLLRYAGKNKVPTLMFTYDVEKGYHVSCGTKTNEKQDRSKSRLLTEIADDVFAPPAALGYGEAIKRIMKKTEKSERTAKEYLKELLAHDLVEKGSDKNWRRSL